MGSSDDRETLKATFLKLFANVPVPLREEIIAVIGTNTFTWLSAKAEIERNTPASNLILKQLKKIGVI